jgi:hypothetical protein
MLLFLVLLAVGSSARAELSLVGEKLVLDVFVASSAHWWQVQAGGLVRSEFAIERVSAPVGLTGRLSPVASLRVSCDISYLQAQDLYVDLHWPDGFGMRAGQFKLPVGVDLMTSPEQLKLVNNSLLTAFARPVDVRDVGLAGTWRTDPVSVVLAVVDGNGPNTGDNNDRKDFCGRVVVDPWSRSGIELAARAYYGWPDPVKAAWRTVGVEGIVERKRLSLRVELQNHESAELHNNAGYAQVAYAAGAFEPACRFDWVLPRNEKIEFMATGGVNFKPLGDQLKFMLDASYRRSFEGHWGVAGFLIRLQGSL